MFQHLLYLNFTPVKVDYLADMCNQTHLTTDFHHNNNKTVLMRDKIIVSVS